MKSVFAVGVWAVGALAGLPASAELSTTLPPTVSPVPRFDQIDTEMTVQNWILCTTEANAESIARARADGIEPARKVYGDLRNSKACGQFPAMRVILRQSLYESAPGAGPQTRVYRASVNLGSEWPTGFVVSGGLTE
jgi:hypothetical protein